MPDLAEGSTSVFPRRARTDEEPDEDHGRRAGSPRLRGASTAAARPHNAVVAHAEQAETDGSMSGPPLADPRVHRPDIPVTARQQPVRLGESAVTASIADQADGDPGLTRSLARALLDAASAQAGTPGVPQPEQQKRPCFQDLS